MILSGRSYRAHLGFYFVIRRVMALLLLFPLECVLSVHQNKLPVLDCPCSYTSDRSFSSHLANIASRSMITIE